MLKTLRIRDLVLVESLELEFDEGLNLLTGQTGAGKSILLDALALLIGSRGDRQRVREGKQRAVVEAVIELRSGTLPGSWCEDHGVEGDEDGLWILRRELGSDGRSRSFLNGSPTPLRTLVEFGNYWLELHGQHDQQKLLRPENHLRLLDAFGGHDLELERTALTFDAVLERREALERWQATMQDREQRVEALRRQIADIEEVAPRVGELAELDGRRNRLRHGAALREGLDRVADWLHEGDESAVARAARAARETRGLAELDPELRETADRLESAMLELEDLGRVLEDTRQRLDAAPENLEQVVSRRAAIEGLCLRYGEDEAVVLAGLADAKQELQALQDPDTELARAESELQAAREAYREAADTLTVARKSAAKRLAPAWLKQLRPLAMPDAQLQVNLESARGEALEAAEPRLTLARLGADRVELLLSANPGVPPRSLQKIASGGELSRVMLALAIVGGTGLASTQVFDEVDQGVGGAVADAVGSRLATLAGSRQLLCVTHLPQVAAYASRHLLVSKQVRKGQTRTRVVALDHDSRVDEIARMLSGKLATEASRAHARQLIGATEDRVGSSS